VTDPVPVEQQLHCFGYFGFGGGYAMHKWGTTADDDNAVYCNQKCPLSQDCWTRHRDRVRELYPDLVALSDRIATRYQGQAYMEEWVRVTRQHGTAFVEPYLNVLMGNMEDGVLRAQDQPAKYRGAGTLSWPLKRLR
jgi:hypothetical protein